MAVERRLLRNSVASGVLWSQALMTALVYMLALLAMYVLMSYALETGQRWLDDRQYGMPRQVHLSGYTGPSDQHGPPTHFIALNIERQVSVLVIPGGNTDHISALQGPYIVGNDGQYVIPQPSLHDMNHDGYIDLIVTLRGEKVIYLNQAGNFRLITAEERAALEQSYQQAPQRSIP